MDDNERQSFASRVLCWAAAVYLLFLALPGALVFVPLLGRLVDFYDAGRRWLVVRFAENVLGTKIVAFPAGSGDTTYNYVETLLHLLAAMAIGALLAWRVRSVSRVRKYAFEAVLRFFLAANMLSYGIAKVLPMQFGEPTLDRLVQPFGEASPMGVLWTFMGASQPYQVFGGLAEVLGGLLLFSRRTTLLGALVSAGVMVNVVMMNLCYDVPVKLFSSHLLLVALVLAAPDAKRLFRFLVLRRDIDGGAPSSPFSTVRGRRGALGLEVAMMAFLLWGVAQEVLAFGAEDDAYRTPPHLVGDYRVVEFHGEPSMPQWTRLTFGERFGVYVVDNAERGERAWITLNEEGTTFSMRSRAIGAKPFQFALAQSEEGTTITLTGTAPGSPERVVAVKRPAREWLLTSRGFHFVNEYSFNR